MAQTMVFDSKKKIGRPATGIGKMIAVRLQPDQLTALDTWAEKQDPKPTRPEAIRQLLTAALKR